MSEIQMMNSDLLEILKNYLEICSFFNEKLEDIKADEILNMNLELLKASITDLNINIANFKSDLKTKQSRNHTNPSSSSSSSSSSQLPSPPNIANTGDNYTELDKKNLLALFFMYLMQIDKDSILNNPNFASSNTSKTAFNSQSKPPNVSNSIPPSSSQSILDKKIYDYPELD